MLKHVPLIALMILSACGPCPAQAAQKESGKCSPPSENCILMGCKRGEPVIFGKPYLAPKFSVRVVDENTGKPLAGISIIMHYVWRWLEYPYQEHPFGAWSEESYSSSCVTDKEGVFEADEFRVVPHGWYKGFYALGHKPRFSHMEISMSLTKCIHSQSFSRRELDKCRRRGTCELTLKASCNLLSK